MEVIGYIVFLIIGGFIGIAITALCVANKSPIKHFKCPKCGEWMTVSYTWEERHYADK